MIETETPKKKLQARATPSQQRSQERVEKILEATVRLLEKSRTDDQQSITTNHVAQEAGVSIGSLYRYFPNMESIVFALFQATTDNFHHVLDKFNSKKYLSLPRQAFFEKLFRTLQKAEPKYAVGLEIHNAMKTYPALADADKDHADRVATKIAAFLKYYGSAWSQKKLHRLALYVYYIDYGTWLYLDHVDPPTREYSDWEFSSLMFNVERCFDEP